VTGATTTPSYGAVILSMGNRPGSFPQALESLLSQRGVDLDVVVVGNGWEPTGLPEGVTAVALPENVGIPEGRNIGAANVGGDLIFFFDDDAFLPDDTVLARMAEHFERDRRVAMVQPRAVDPSGLPSPRRWVPRLRTGDPGQSSVATIVWEGVFAIRREAFEAVGGWPGHFFYGHEGIDLAWRVWDGGWTGWYAADIIVNHPATSPTRHEVFYRMNARNRVWVALRNLPWPLVAPYIATWVALTLLRVHSPTALRAWFRGLAEGAAGGYGERRPMRWRTVARLTSAGRPPLV
jgi:GT2 family glycosyltransferase